MNNLMKRVILLLLITSCSAKTDSQQASNGASPKLYIKTTTATGVDDNQVVVDTTTMVDSDYFEVTLSVMGIGLATYYIGSKDIEKGQSVEDFRWKYFNIVENDSIVKFNGSGEFINYMSERGYEMVDEQRNKYSNDYTFKRK